ncbi:MAG: hypothetical protein ACKO7B_13255, partial [Flavobacteriales bacterium]
MFMKVHQLLAILLLSNSVVAQIIMPADTRRQWDQLRLLSANSETLKPEQLESFPIYEINGQSFLSVMGKTVDHPEWASLRELGVIQGASVGRITTAKIPMSSLSNVQLERVFSYVEIPSKVAPALDR